MQLHSHPGGRLRMSHPSCPVKLSGQGPDEAWQDVGRAPCWGAGARFGQGLSSRLRGAAPGDFFISLQEEQLVTPSEIARPVDLLIFPSSAA